MAESNDLDDFFAKKDKSKKKNKSKYTANDLLEQGKESKKEKKKKTKDKENSQSAGSEKTQAKEDEEWVEIDTEADYTGLRIQSLQSKQEEEAAEAPEEPELDEDGEVIERKDTNEGPWKKVEGQQAPMPAPVEKDVTEVIEEAATLVITDGKYVPPHQRGGAAASSTPTPLRQARRSKKTAPNLQSDFDFPTLGGAQESSRGADTGRQFERVRGGGRQMDDSYGKSSQVELGNKYDALKY